jgi:hypothetical protein
MAAGRPSKVDTLTLYVLARYFYGEFTAIQRGPGKRFVLNEYKKANLVKIAEETSQLRGASLAGLEQGVDRQIALGHLPAGEREGRLRDLREDIEFDRLFGGTNAARMLSKKSVNVRREPEIIDRLLNAKTPAQIKRICAKAFANYSEVTFEGSIAEVPRPSWPISNASLLPGALSQHASAFIEARSGPKFPKSDRPSSRSKQLWFLARALAGFSYGLETRTAINRISSVRPDEKNGGIQITKRRRQSKKRGSG